MRRFWPLITVLIAGHHLLHVRGEDRIDPIRQCDNCLEPALKSAPGVGFHLGLTSGTVAISYGSGRAKDVAHIKASPEYIALMHVLTSDTERLRPPPVDTIVQRLAVARKAVTRRVNLLLGRPGSPEAATLSSMLRSLRDKAQARSSTQVATVGIALANAALASSEEINDALVYAGLQPLGEWQVPDRELNAAYGASGFGLCTSYTDPFRCAEEESGFGSGDVVLHLDYTSKTLAANTARISTARQTYSTTWLVHWGLGRDGAVLREKEGYYWDEVRRCIQALVMAEKKPYTRLLLTGDRAEDKKFREVVKDALRNPGITNHEQADDSRADLIFAVARGAAEFQWRRQRGWLDCAEPQQCIQAENQKNQENRGAQRLEL